MATFTRSKYIRLYDFWMKCFAVLSFIIFVYYVFKDWLVGVSDLLDKILLLFGVVFCTAQMVFMVLKEKAKRRYFQKVK